MRPPAGWNRWYLVSALLVAGALVCGSSMLIYTRMLLPGHSIQRLTELPIGHSITIIGTVTYADSVNHRFWMQDATGAILINHDPAQLHVRAGQTIAVTGIKTRHYDPAQGFGSVNFAPDRTAPVRSRIQLPPPLAASLRNLPHSEKSGLQLKLTAMVRDVTRDADGRAQLSIADTGPEFTAILPSYDDHLVQLVNTKVSIVGIGEEALNPEGAHIVRRLWVRDSTDIQPQEATPASTPLYSIRDLYRAMDPSDGHSVRVRGRVAALVSGRALLLEDTWGTVRCAFSETPPIRPGAAVEISGFPSIDGLRIDLFHCTVKQISPDLLREQPDQQLQRLTSANAVRELSANDAKLALPVRLRGVVTYNDPVWRQMFIQDSTGGIYAKYADAVPPLHAGDEVTLTGLSNPGNFAPVIVAPKFQVHGRHRLPVPAPINPRDAADGILDSQYVQVEGVVHPIKEGQEPDHLTFELYSSLGQVHVYTSQMFTAVNDWKKLEDATVRIRGVFGTVFNSRRQLVGYQLSTSSPDDVQVLEPAPQTSSSQALTPIGNLLQFSQHTHFRHRVRIQGSVTMIGRDLLYLQDSTGGVQIHAHVSSLHLGDLVEAIGYASAGPYSPVLNDASINAVDSNHAIAPISTTADTLLRGHYDSQLVSVQGKVLTVIDGPSGKNLVMQSGSATFQAQLNASEVEIPSANLQPGAVLRLSGVCAAQVDPSQLYLLLSDEPVSFNLLLRTPADLTLVRPAPWWTSERTLVALGLLSAAILLVLVWVSVLRRRVHIQKNLLQKAAETRQAIGDLVHAMNEVSRQQDFNTFVSVRGNERIADLVVHFNEMLRQLQQRDQAKQEAESKLQRQALTDALTGLPNRRLFADRLEQVLARARRDSWIVALLYIDLDGFKLVNDSLGHPVGDILLCEVADRLRSRIRESDTLARLGGDEFTVVLSKIAQIQDAELVATELLSALAGKFVIEGQEITIGASIGISLFPNDGADADELLQHADGAMYAAKRNGKNQVRTFTEDMGTSVRERLTLENQLRSALDNGEITIQYQPEFDVISNRVVRFEALARWTHPTLGSIPPSKFIPVAEESGLILPLGEYIMERACREALTWQSRSEGPVQVAVNVSNVQFARQGFIDEVTAILQRTGLKPELLQLELTESFMVSNTERARMIIERFRALGVSVAVDDFGTGYSSLSYLPRLSFDALKIDRSFITDVASRADTRAMVQSLITLAHNFGMRVIVEGIETREQLEAVRKLGTNDVQGYYFGRPTSDPTKHLPSAISTETQVFTS